jgi:hypothetical protein
MITFLNFLIPALLDKGAEFISEVRAHIGRILFLPRIVLQINNTVHLEKLILNKLTVLQALCEYQWIQSTKNFVL